MQPQQLQPQQLQPQQGGNYPGWGARPMPPAPGNGRAPDQRPPTAASHGAPRKAPLKPWVLIIGALLMALLAFAVTRAFIHTAATHTATPDK